MIYSENILICMALPLLLTVVLVKGGTRRFVLSFILGMVTCLLGAYVSGFIDASWGYGTSDTAIFISPVVEEAMKFLPLLFCFLMFEPGDEELFLMAVGLGTGFASFENVCTMVSSGAESLDLILVRGLAVGVMHIVSVSVLALGLVLARHFKITGISSILGALSASMLYHGIYNLLVSESGNFRTVGFALPVITAFLLYYIYRQLRIH